MPTLTCLCGPLVPVAGRVYGTRSTSFVYKPEIGREATTPGLLLLLPRLGPVLQVSVFLLCLSTNRGKHQVTWKSNTTHNLTQRINHPAVKNKSIVMSGVLNFAKGLVDSVVAKGSNILNAVFPPEQRAALLTKLQAFAAANPKLAVRF